MISDDAPVAFRSDTSVELVERGTDTTIRLRPARAGSALTPTSATITVLDANGTAVVSAGVATCTASSGQATYTVLGATTTALPFAERWTVVWSVLLPGESVARTVRTEAALVRARLYPVVSDQDLFGRVSGLNPESDVPICTIEDYSPYLDGAWSTIQEKLIAKGRRHWLVLSPASLRELHLVLTLERVFEDLASRLNPAWAETAAQYRTNVRDEWGDLKLVYDESDTGTVGGAGARRSANGTTWLGGASMSGRWPWR